MSAPKWWDRLTMFTCDADSDAVGALTFPERQTQFERPAIDVCRGAAQVGRFVDRMTFEAERFGLPDEAEEYRQGYLDALGEVASLMAERIGSVPVLRPGRHSRCDQG